MADDTGLEVDALDGAPGVWSARYAGEDATYADNVAKLLAELKAACARADRTARFRTVALVALARRPRGRRRGRRAPGSSPRKPAGRAGFGYDPVFVPDDGDGRTFAEMTAAEKHAISATGAGPSGPWPRSCPPAAHWRSQLTAESPAAAAVTQSTSRPRLARRLHLAGYQPRRSTGQTSTTSSPSTT